VQIYAGLPGVEVTALADLYLDRAKNQQKWVKEQGKPDAEVFGGSEDAWKKLCESDKVDLVHVATPWLLHTPMALYAMRCGKHAVVEVPAAVTVDECWELVETSEATQRHCMMLENCCYGENEMFALMLCRKGVLGDLVHGEGAYLHDLAGSKFAVHIRPSVFCPCWRTRAHTPSQSLPSRPENAAILCLSTPRVNAGRQKIPSGPAPLPYALPRT